jgi:hypothetical protein
MAIIYTTETPRIDTRGYHFSYHTKRDSYLDCCYACFTLNKAAKRMPDNYKHYVYKLKIKLIEMLYRQGYCVRAYFEQTRIWYLQFEIEKKVFEWHLPEKVVTWPIHEFSTGTHFEWREDKTVPFWPLTEAIALLEWCLSA